MELAILLSLAASVCTATSSVCQRLGARHLERCGDWSAYVLMGVGTGAMPLAHAMAAGPLAAPQPGFTIGDPVTAILLSGSELITHTTQPRRPEAGEATNRELTGRSR
jgi:hypothetical protein